MKLRWSRRILLFVFGVLTGIYALSLMGNDTMVIEEGFYVSRVDGFFGLTGKTKYTVDFTTGQEDINIHGFIFGDSVFIGYDSVNNKITSIFYPDDHLYFGLLDSGRVTKARVGIYTEVPYESVKHHFERALVIRNKVRERFSHLFQMAPARVAPKTSDLKIAPPSPSQ